jgi:hypothetical protein
MAFDVDRFITSNWQRRTANVAVDTLKEFFDKDEKPIWQIQSLEGSELAQAKHAKERNIRLKASAESIAEILSTKNKTKLKESISGIFGNIDAENDTAWRTELLILGSVKPAVDYQLAAMLFKARPTEYYNLTNEIIRLSGLGHEPGKQPSSGMTKKSKTH